MDPVKFKELSLENKFANLNRRLNALESGASDEQTEPAAQPAQPAATVNTIDKFDIITHPDHFAPVLRLRFKENIPGSDVDMLSVLLTGDLIHGLATVK